MLKRLRENYFFSVLLSSAAKPLHSACATIAEQIRKKVRRNGVQFRLPNGRIMSIAPNAGVALATSVFWHGLDGFEPETSRTLRFFFERSETFVDVGANYGIYALLGALWNPWLRVVAFEPLPEIFERLQENVVLNNLQDRVTAENIALSDSTGQATLYLPDAEGKDVESTGTLASESWQVRKGARPVPVETVRFDEYESLHPMRVDLVKIDVEDFEAGVLRGMAAIIKRDRPFIVCEILPRNREHRNEATRRIIEELGYTAYWITSAGYIHVLKFDFEREFTNFLLSPVPNSNEIFDTPAALWDLRQQSLG